MANFNLIDWLQHDRKLDPALLELIGVKQVDHPSLKAAIAFPYKRSGKGYAAKFRTQDKRWASTKGVTRGLFNADALLTDPHQPVILTEGEIDCLSVVQAGFSRAVSLPDGWNPQGNKVDALTASEAQIKECPYIIVAGDNDEAGESLPRAVANLFPEVEVCYAIWPDDCKDANDVLMKYGEGELAARLNKARENRLDPPGGIITGFSDLPPLSERRVLRIPHQPFNRFTAFELGAMSVITGIPGCGKSTFVTWAADEIAQAENIRVGFMSFETHPHRVRDQLSRKNTGKPFDDLLPDEQERLTSILDVHWRMVHRVYDETQHHLGWLHKMVHELAVRHRCKMIIIDPWNELEHLPNPGESMTAYIGYALQQIRVWAEKYETHICVVAHPKKINSEGERPRAPIGYDIADSAAWMNKPSLGLTVHRDQDDAGNEIVKIVTWKVRDTMLYGFENSIVKIDFNPEMGSYHRLQGARP